MKACLCNVLSGRSTIVMSCLYYCTDTTHQAMSPSDTESGASGTSAIVQLAVHCRCLFKLMCSHGGANISQGKYCADYSTLCVGALLDQPPMFVILPFWHVSFLCWSMLALLIAFSDSRSVMHLCLLLLSSPSCTFTIHSTKACVDHGALQG